MKVRQFLEKLSLNNFDLINIFAFRALDGNALTEYEATYRSERKKFEEVSSELARRYYRAGISIEYYNKRHEELHEKMNKELLKKLLDVLEIPE